jgi:hypothetical protein
MALAKKRIFATDTHRFTQIKTRKNALLLCTLILKQGLQVHRSKRTRMNCPAAAQRGVRFGKRPPGSQEIRAYLQRKNSCLAFFGRGIASDDCPVASAERSGANFVQMRNSLEPAAPIRCPAKWTEKANLE